MTSLPWKLLSDIQTTKPRKHAKAFGSPHMLTMRIPGWGDPGLDPGYYRAPDHDGVALVAPEH